MSITERKAAAILRQQRYKLTMPRRAVLKSIVHSRSYFSPAELHRRVQQEHPGVGLVTVYRTLGLLARLGIICEVHTGSNSRSYCWRRPTAHHHHLICNQCGKVWDFTDCNLDELEITLARRSGFEIEGHLLEFTGRCRQCRQQAAGA